MIPELTAEEFKWNDKRLSNVFAIDNALVVTNENVTGTLDDDKVDWIAKIPKTLKDMPSNGPAMIYDVRGHNPDAVDVYFEYGGRAPMPTFLPLTGKGQTFDSSGGGGVGTLLPARIGGTLLMATWSSLYPFSIRTVRGPAITRKFIDATKCKPGEAASGSPDLLGPAAEKPLIFPRLFESTADGTIVSVGSRCGQETAAEVWNANSTTSHFVDIGPLFRTDGNYRGRFWRDGTSGLWGYWGKFDDVLHFAGGSAGGKMSLGPHLDSPIVNAFASPNGRFYVLTADGTIQRMDEDHFEPVARLAKIPDDAGFWSMAADDKGTIWMGREGSGVFKLKETARVPAVPACPSWLVYLLSTRAQPPNWTYPATQKALATFPDAAKLRIVEFDSYPMLAGLKVASKQQGEAVMAHLKTTAPDMNPALFCYSPAKITREVEMKP